MRRLAGAILVAVALVGCGDTRTIETGRLAASDHAATSVAPTTTVAADQPVTTTEPPVTRTPEPTTPTTAAPPPPPVPANPSPSAPPGRHPVAWESFQVGADNRTLVFTYYAGVPPCSVFDSIDAVEGPAQVVVTIYERPADAGHEVVCVAMAQQKSATVTLRADLGGRTVVDGGR